MQIKVTPETLIWAWGILHVGYALVTHYHWLYQTKKFLREYNRDVVEQRERGGYARFAKIDSPAFGATAWRLIIGLEAKIVEVVVWLMARALKMFFFASFSAPWKLRWHMTPNDSTCVE